MIDRFRRWLKKHLFQDDPRPVRDVAWLFDENAEAFTLAGVDAELAEQLRLPRRERDYDLILFLVEVRPSLLPAGADTGLPGRIVGAAPIVPGRAS